MSRVWSPVLVGLAAVGLSACSSSLNPLNDSVSYRPSVATVVESPNCLAEDIYTALTRLGPWDPALTPNAPAPGYPPAHFQPVAVQRCERGIDETGALTVDSVRLEGDISAVDAAFSADSERFPDGVTPSCVYAMEPPAGLWFVNEAGEAFRPAWPASPCGLQNAPIDALAGLTEVSRSYHPTGFDSGYTTSCESSSYGTAFADTSSDEVAAAQQREREGNIPVVPSLVMPIDDVDALKLCTYTRIAGEQSIDPGNPVVGSQTTLKRADSAALVRSISDAPLAPACDQSATRTTSTELRRPDGSGRSFVSFELDGCQRASGFGFYFRAIPADALAILARPA